MSVSVSELTKIFGQQKAVDHINFSAKSGEILGFLGPNGAGKTTTMKMLSCFTQPSSGSATVCGFDVEESPMEVKKRIGYLPENNPLYKDMYVKEYLRFIANIHHVDKNSSRIQEMIDMTGLGKECHKKIGELSKGYRQRVGLAQAMIHNPEVLILDEPTSGLDPNQLVEIRQLIKTLGEEKTVIFSTHIMQEVQALCDRVVIINNGKIVADDPISQLSSRVNAERVVEVEFDKVPDLEKLSQLDGVLALHKIRDYSFKIKSTKDIDIRKDLFDFSVKSGIRIIGLTQQSASVEEVFQELTKKEL
jgi:ABC-2 type transport system ATP-binding protein